MGFGFGYKSVYSHDICFYLIIKIKEINDEADLFEGGVTVVMIVAVFMIMAVFMVVTVLMIVAVFMVMRMLMTVLVFMMVIMHLFTFFFAVYQYGYVGSVYAAFDGVFTAHQYTGDTQGIETVYEIIGIRQEFEQRSSKHVSGSTHVAFKIQGIHGQHLLMTFYVSIPHRTATCEDTPLPCAAILKCGIICLVMAAKRQKKPYEYRKSTQNGVKRLILTGISIIVQIVLFLLFFTKLHEYARWLNIITSVASLALVLALYSQNKTSTMKMPWIILILAFPILGVALYLLVGLDFSTRSMRERFAETDAVLLPELPANDEQLNELADIHRPSAGIASYIRSAASYPVYHNTDITYYDNAAKGLEAQLSALRNAKDFIFMEYHAIEDDKAWARIEEILAERADAGVDVRVFYDDMGSIGFINTDFVKKLNSLGISCKVFNPFTIMLNFFLNNRDHRKITVIDNRIAFTGGYNLANEYFNLTHPYGEWKDTGIRLEGDAVRSFTIMFLEMWAAGQRKGDPIEDVSQFLKETSYKASQKGFCQPYADNPIDRERIGEEVYISMIEKAERYCYFMTPYLILTDEMMHALCLAAKRGVDVRIITPGIPDKKMIYRITRSFYHSLVIHGVKIYEWTPGFCHAKMSLVDDKMATVGTINLDYRSLYHHFENGCFISGSPVISEIKEDFELTFAESRDVTEDYMSGSATHLPPSQLFMRLFAELL